MDNKGNGIVEKAKGKFLMLLLGGGCGSAFFILMFAFPLFVAVLIILGILGGDSNNSMANNGYTVTCDNQAADFVARLTFYEQSVGDFFAKLTTAAIAVNNAGGTSYSDMLTLTKNNYTTLDNIKNRSSSSKFDSMSESSKGQYYYIAEAVLSGKYKLPKNLIFQKGTPDGGTTWTSIQHENSVTYFAYTGKSLESTSYDGEELPSEAYGSNSLQYYQNLAKSLEKDDYSTYTSSSICISGCESSNSEYNFENTMVTVMDGRNKVVLATVSLEDYVIGVSCIEIGACSGSVENMDANYIKAQFVAGRTYALNRGKYNSSSKSITIRASTRDQGWCDLKRGCYSTKDGNFSNFYYGGYNNKNATRTFTDKDLELLHTYYQETYGELFLSEKANGSLTSISSGTSYKSTTQNFWSWAAKKGYDYGTILKATANPSSLGYSKNISDTDSYKNKYLYQFGKSCSSSYNGTLQDLKNYPIGNDGLKILNTNISNALGSDGVTQLDNYIKSSVDKAGYGTGAGVAAAGQSLAYGLHQRGYYLGHCWGGDRTSVGIGKRWGNSSSSCNSPNKTHKYYGMDCSGFVSWAIRNGCDSKYGARTASGYLQLGKSIDLKDAKPGDLLASSGHVILIVKNNGDGSVITVEEGGNYEGLAFSKFTSKKHYSVRDMSGWYSKNCKSSR